VAGVGAGFGAADRTYTRLMGRTSTARKSLPQATFALRPYAADSALAQPVTTADVDVLENCRVALHGHG
jgi:hypothetical protein